MRMLNYFFAIFFYFLHIQTDIDKYRIWSRYDKHHIYGSHGLRLHIRPDLLVETGFFLTFYHAVSSSKRINKNLK